MPCKKNSQQTGTLKIHISEIIKYTTKINITQKTQRALILASKFSPTGCRPRMFLPTIENVVHLLSTTCQPKLGL